MCVWGGGGNYGPAKYSIYKYIYKYILLNNYIIVQTLINIRNKFGPGWHFHAIDFINQFKKRKAK